VSTGKDNMSKTVGAGAPEDASTLSGIPDGDPVFVGVIGLPDGAVATVKRRLDRGSRSPTPKTDHK
jgi:hypothetical protein